MKKLRVSVLVHEALVPPDTLAGVSEKEMAVWKTEYDVVAELKNIGHDVLAIGLRDDLGKLRSAHNEFKPHVAFNLLEEFHDVAAYDQNVAGYLELMRQPYSGCNPRGLLLSRDKGLSKQILMYHRIPTAQFKVFPLNRRFKMPKRLRFPLFVKSATEDASLALAQASIVNDEEKLRERVAFVHEQTESPALVEEYIDGRELYVGVMGNERLTTFPVWELDFGSMPDDVLRVATRKVKWDEEYRKKYKIDTGKAKNLPAGMEDKIAHLAKRIYRALQMSGYARMDMRLTADGRIYVLEANANPELSYGDDFAESAASSGFSYGQLLQRIINYGLSYRAAWRS